MGNITLYGIFFKASEFVRHSAIKRVEKKIFGGKPSSIKSGPFKGMLYNSDEKGSTSLPKYIGCYEQEIQHAIHFFLKKNFCQIFNIGAADGYYAVGFALNSTSSKIFAFESNSTSQAFIKSNAQLNSVDKKIEILGTCDCNILSSYCFDNSLILSDCEGAEVDIFCDSLLPKLSFAHLLIELHDGIRPGCSRELERRFSKTHYIHYITSDHKEVNEASLLHGLTHYERMLATDERRLGIQEWGIYIPKSSSDLSLLDKSFIA